MKKTLAALPVLVIGLVIATHFYMSNEEKENLRPIGHTHYHTHSDGTSHVHFHYHEDIGVGKMPVDSMETDTMKHIHRH